MGIAKILAGHKAATRDEDLPPQALYWFPR